MKNLNNQKGISIIEILLIPILYVLILGTIVVLMYFIAPYSPYNLVKKQQPDYKSPNEKVFIKSENIEQKYNQSLDKTNNV